MRTITIPLEEILDLVSAADLYGYDDDVLMTSLFEFAKPTEEEIAEFSKRYLTEEYAEQGYGEEDYREILTKLLAWYAKHNV